MEMTPEGSASHAVGLRRAGVTSSANTRDALVTAGIEGLFEDRVDGVAAERGASVVVSDLSELSEDR